MSIPVLVALTSRFRTKRNNPGYFQKVDISQSLAVRNNDAEPSEISTEPLGHLQTGHDHAASGGFFYRDINTLGSETREMIVRQIWHRAQEMLREKNIQAAVLRMKTVVPVLQYASLEEDQYLQDRWAAMLANAATQNGPIHTAFPEVLRQLTVQEVRFAEALYTLAEQRTIELRNVPPQRQAAESVLTLGTPSDLHKLYCAAVHTESTSNSMYDFSIALDNLRRCQVIQGPGIDHSQISFTAFGVEFISACKPPELDTE